MVLHWCMVLHILRRLKSQKDGWMEEYVSHLNSLNSTVPPLWVECYFLSIAVVKTETRLSTFNFWVESSTR